MFVIAIKQSGPLLWANAKPCLHGHANNLPIMLASQGLVGTKLNQVRKQWVKSEQAILYSKHSLLPSVA